MVGAPYESRRRSLLTIVRFQRIPEVVSIPGKGRGVIAKCSFEPRDVIEKCPLVFLREEEEAAFVKQHGVLWYYAIDLTAVGRTALHLGLGMLYNHSSTPNSEIVYQAGDDFLLFVATSRILPGEEIVYDYEFEGEPEYLPQGGEIA